MITFDFSKAFDKIDYNLLLNKVFKCEDINLNFCKWLTSYLKDRKQRVKINGTYSDITDITSGVPQGSILGPLLFSLYISDLKCLRPNYARLVKYADDTTLLFQIKDVNDLEYLKEEIDNVYKWTNKNRMTINSNKSNLMYFSKTSMFVEIRTVSV